MSFRFQINLLFILLLSAIGLGSLLFFKHEHEQVIQINLQEQADAIGELIAPDLAKLIYMDDPDVAADITQRITQIGSIYAVYFFNTDHQPILNVQPQNIRAIESPIGIRASLDYQGLTLGEAHYIFVSDALTKKQQSIHTYFLSLSLVVVLLTLLFAFYIDKRFIIRLSALNKALADTTEQKDFAIRLPICKQDEIGQARQNFNALVSMVEAKTAYLKHQANHDSLTGLFNRHYLLQQIDETLADQSEPHALCYLDLDQFKVVNDTCGHLAGDALLLELANQLQHYVNNQPDLILGRIGGDEFILLIKNRSQQQTEQITHEIQDLVHNFHFQYLEREFLIGISMGVIFYQNQHSNAQALLSAADAACYQAKNEGRDKVIMYSLGDAELLEHQQSMNWVSQIYHALEHNEFELYWQPILPAQEDDSDYKHFETLIRLKRHGEIMSPYIFMPTAERYGLSKKIDLWVLTELCRQLSHARDFLDSISLVTINLSADTLMDELLILDIEAILDNYQIPYNKLCFEITETGMISNLQTANRFIDHFTKQGIQFALDDFGAGMSSFGYLKDLPVSYLKIDGGFVKDIETNLVMREMVSAMINIGQITNKKVVAEYVETDKAVKLLKDLKVDFIQGYFYSEPKPIQTFIQAENKKTA